MSEKILDEELEVRLSYHPPKTEQLDRYDFLRKKCGELARIIVANTPASREQSQALANLDAVCMFANAAIARRE